MLHSRGACVDSTDTAPTGRNVHPRGMSTTQYYLWIGCVAIYLCKDCIGGRSIAKRVTNLKVIDNKTGEAASPLQCLVRNILIFIFPLEILVVLFSPQRRLGDRLAGTRVNYFEPWEPRNKINF